MSETLFTKTDRKKLQEIKFMLLK